MTRVCESATAVGDGEFFQIPQIRQRCHECRHLYTICSDAPLLAAHFEIPLKLDRIALLVFISSWRPPVNARNALHPSYWLNNAYEAPMVADQLLYRGGNLGMLRFFHESVQIIVEFRKLNCGCEISQAGPCKGSMSQSCMYNILWTRQIAEHLVEYFQRQLGGHAECAFPESARN